MMTRRTARRGERMIQWIGVLIAIVGLAYNGVKDYQKGDIKLPKLPQKQVLTKPVYPIQYCLMAYDPNIDKVFYLHENGIWHDYAPQQRRYAATTTQHYQGQEGYAVGGSTGTQGTSGYGYGQSSKAPSHSPRY
jgi:hypothetical protein